MGVHAIMNTLFFNSPYTLSTPYPQVLLPNYAINACKTKDMDLDMHVY